MAIGRAHRPDVAKGAEPVCPFCLGKEGEEKEVYRVGGKVNDSNWQIRVVPNKFPFAPIHEIIIHSPDHHKNFGQLSLSQVELIFQTYRQRYNIHQNKGQVYIFHNRGEAGGESLPHPHTQLAVVPFDVKMDIPRLANNEELEMLKQVQDDKIEQETKHFTLFCPLTSQWPDEVWIAPKKRGRGYGEIVDDEIVDLSYAITRLVKALEEKFGVSAAMMTASTQAASASLSEASDEPKEEQTVFNVVIANSGANKISVIKALRELVPTLGLKEAKDLVDGAPKEVMMQVNKKTAEEAKTKLTTAGATVELK